MGVWILVCVCVGGGGSWLTTQQAHRALDDATLTHIHALAGVCRLPTSLADLLRKPH